MELWSIGMLHLIGSLFYTDTPVVESITLDTSQVQFSPMIESIYKAHYLTLCFAAREYENKYNRSTSITQLQNDMRSKNLATLLMETKAEVREICGRDEVQKIFRQAYEKTSTGADISERLECWTEFITQLYKTRRLVRTEKLPSVWFPEQYDTSTEDQSSEGEFIARNAAVVLDKSQRKYVIAGRVINFLPFALIEQHDKESFNAFLAVRHATQE